MQTRVWRWTLAHRFIDIVVDDDYFCCHSIFIVSFERFIVVWDFRELVQKFHSDVLWVGGGGTTKRMKWRYRERWERLTVLSFAMSKVSFKFGRRTKKFKRFSAYTFYFHCFVFAFAFLCVYRQKWSGPSTHIKWSCPLPVISHLQLARPFK